MHLRHLHIMHLQSLKGEMQEIYINRVLKTFSLSLIGIFVPIFLLDLGYTVHDAISFYLIVYFSMFVANPLAAAIASKIGEKHTIFISTLMEMLFLVSLFYLEYRYIPLYVLAAFYGVGAALYWVPLNTNFAVYGKNEERGKEIGYLMAIPRLFSIAAPSIAASIIVYFGYNPLLAVALLVMAMSALPLFWTPDRKFKVGKGLKNLLKSGETRYYGLFMAQGAIFAAELLWPIYIYLVIPDYFFVGFVSTILGIGYSLVMITIGKVRDRLGGKKIIKFGSFLGVFLWLAAASATEPYALSVISFFMGAVFIMIDLPIFAAVCNSTNEKNGLANIVVRDNGLSTGRVIFFMFALAIPLSIMFETMFTVTALVSLYIFLKS